MQRRNLDDYDDDDGADDGVDDNHDHDLHDVGDWTKNGQWLSISIRYCLVKVSDRNWDMMMMVVVVITMVMMMMTVLVVVIIIAMIIMKLATGPKMVSGYLTVHSRQLPGPPTLVPMSQLQIIPFSLFLFFHCLFVSLNFFLEAHIDKYCNQICTLLKFKNRTADIGANVSSTNHSLFPFCIVFV